MSQSPITGFPEGSTGKSIHNHESIGYSGERTEPPLCRIIMAGGVFTSAATERDRQRAAAAQGGPSQPSPRTTEQSNPRSRKSVGRPPKLAHLKPEVARLRAEGLSWAEVGNRLGVNPQAARMLVRDRRRASP